MGTMVIDREILPEPISSRISSEKVRVSEEGGKEPTAEKLDLNVLFGLFRDGRLSSYEFLRQKHREAGIED